MNNLNSPLFIRNVWKILVIVFFSLLIFSACTEQKNKETVRNSEVLNQDSKWVVKSKHLTRQYNLTSLSIECLAFEEQDIVKDKMEIVVREVHNEKCGGDPRTEPRVFSLEVNIATGEFKTDRYSPSAEYESFDNLSIEGGL